MKLDSEYISNKMLTTFNKQRANYLAEIKSSNKSRIYDLLQLKKLLLENTDNIVTAICNDFSNRSRHETVFAEILSAVDGINHTIKNLNSWTKTQRRDVDHLMFLGGRNRVSPQPVGVVGIVVPWNFPIFLAFGPLTSAIAAGNTAMIKMSRNSSTLNKLISEILPRYLPEEKVHFIQEPGGAGSLFTELPFDLLIFTGSGQTGRAVMSAASKNLTPVILELGGKSPAIIDPKYPLNTAIDRIMYTKQLNAGQICTSVDYAFVHESQKSLFIEKAVEWVDTHVPDISHKDYTSIIDERSVRRLEETLKDAGDKGGIVINLNGNQSIDHINRKMPLYIVTDTSNDMMIRNQEIFGPILLLITYSDPSEIVNYINSHDRPLAIYPFSNNKKLVDYYINSTISGGVTVNNALVHVIQHDLPFGGIGASGMGHYHGKDGFISCSKMRPIFYQSKFSFVNRFLSPPYGNSSRRIVNTILKLKS